MTTIVSEHKFFFIISEPPLIRTRSAFNSDTLYFFKKFITMTVKNPSLIANGICVKAKIPENLVKEALKPPTSEGKASAS